MHFLVSFLTHTQESTTLYIQSLEINIALFRNQWRNLTVSIGKVWGIGARRKGVTCWMKGHFMPEKRKNNQLDESKVCEILDSVHFR